MENHIETAPNSFRTVSKLWRLFKRADREVTVLRYYEDELF